MTTGTRQPPPPPAHGRTVDGLVDALRRRILAGDLAPGARLVERELVDAHGVARHTLRAALRRLAADGLVAIEPNRGATVAGLAPDELVDLFVLRLALEREAAHLALTRHDGRLPPAVHAAASRLDRLASRPASRWPVLADAHNAVHATLVTAAGAPRLERAYAALAGELALFVVQLRPVWTRERLGPDHLALVAAIEAEGPDVLRVHLAEALVALTPAGRIR